MLFPLLLAVVFAIPGTALIGTLRHPDQNIAVMAVGLWMMIVVMGWFWVWTMDDGSGALTGEEHAPAKSVSLTNCENRINPQYRVITSDTGRERDLRTWWRFPTTCDAMPRWID